MQNLVARTKLSFLSIILAAQLPHRYARMGTIQKKKNVKCCVKYSENKMSLFCLLKKNHNNFLLSSQ